MEFIFIAAGAIGGALIVKIVQRHTKTHGIIEVDHDIQQCRILITSAELSDRKIKKAVFTVNHDAKISREEQSL